MWFEWEGVLVQRTFEEILNNFGYVDKSRSDDTLNRLKKTFAGAGEIHMAQVLKVLQEQFKTAVPLMNLTTQLSMDIHADSMVRRLTGKAPELGDTAHPLRHYYPASND